MQTLAATQAKMKPIIARRLIMSGLTQDTPQATGLVYENDRECISLFLQGRKLV